MNGAFSVERGKCAGGVLRAASTLQTPERANATVLLRGALCDEWRAWFDRWRPPTVNTQMNRGKTPSLSFGLLCLLPIVGCKYVEELTGKAKTPEVQKSCVEDLQTVGEQKFELEGDLSTRVQAVLTGTVYLRELTEKLSQEVAGACAAIGRDLGDSQLKADDALAPAARVVATCEPTAKLLKKKKEDDGVVLLLYTHAPICSVALDDFSRCLAECDPALAAAEDSGPSCEPSTAMGRCEGKCDGTCVQSFSDDCAGICRGACRGGCDEGFYGKCGGRCIGTCDGSTSSGKCEGICDGKCSDDSNGSCQGRCKGKCAGACLSEVKKRACAGTCSGACSEDLSAQRCGVALPPPEITPACGAMCDAKLTRQLHCVAGYADILVYNSTKAGAGDKIKSALEKRLDVLIGAEEGMKAAIDRAHQGIVDGLNGIHESLQGNAQAEKKVGSCLEDAAELQQEAVEALQTIREVSTRVVLAVKG